MAANQAYIIPDEVEHYKNGEINTDMVQFQFFVMCANRVIIHKPFYDLSIGQINEYFQRVKFFTIEEADIIIANIISRSETKYEAKAMLKRILPSIRCQSNQTKNKYYLSPCCCKDLYEKFQNKLYHLKNGENFKMGKLFDFECEIITKIRLSQERFQDPPQFIHNEDIYQLISSNNLGYLIDRRIEKNVKKMKKVSKPDPWNFRIHWAVKNNDLLSVRYNIYLIPLLRNAKDENGKTPAHIAAEFSNSQMIELLNELGADFHIFDNEGNLPCHYLKEVDNITAFRHIGQKINEINKNGQTILDYKSDPFERDTISKLIELGFDIFDLNKTLIFWAQKVMHNHLYGKSYTDEFYRERIQNEWEERNKRVTKEYIEYRLFQSFVRTYLLVCVYITQEKLNNIFFSILTEDRFTIDPRKDAMLLRKAINEDDFDLAAFCIALGFSLDDDDLDENGLTNLMILTAKNEIEKVSIFASNYCDPNKVNKNGENCFWIAASKEIFEISTLLYEKYNANPDIISNSGQTLMHIAYEKGDHELLYYLLDLGASPNILNHEKETVQFKAFLKRDFENAEIIQNNFNGDINVKDKNGNTLGHIAILENDISFLRYLIKRKINVENKDNFGRSLFMLAIEKLNDISVLQLLLDNGANINTKDNDDNTPFYFICLEKNFNRSKFNFLLKNKFNTYIKSRWNLHSEALAYLNSLNK